MKSRLRLPSTLLISLLAGLATWFTILTWSGFAEVPGDYLRPLALGCLIVALTGALLRSARLHPVLVVVGQVAVVLLWLNHRFAADPSLLGWVPTPDSVRAAMDVLSASVDAAESYAAPVPRSIPTFPPVLIAVGSFLAILVDLLACGARRVPLAGLPLLAMYTAPVSMLEESVPWWKFALIAVAFLLLLAGEEAGRLAHWGRDLGSAAQRGWSRTTNQTVWPSARKIGFTATAIAVVVPVLIPTFTGGVLSGNGEGEGGGDGDINIVNPMLDMKRNLQLPQDLDLLQVTTDDPSPEYIRVAVLDTYEEGQWTPTDREIPVENRVDGGLPSPAGLEEGVKFTEYDYDFQAAEIFKSEWLPVQFPTRAIEVAGDWRYDSSTHDIVSAAKGKNIHGQDYSVVGLDVEPSADDLTSSAGTPPDLFRRYTDLPPEVSDDVTAEAQRVTQGATNRAERAVLLQQWFTERRDDPDDPQFEYDLVNADRGSSIEALEDFLKNSRTGYCEQFAGAMALMARTLNIPARVAVGFLKPEAVEGVPNTYMFSAHDYHAWPELYFGDVGWVRFEPTPSNRQGATAPSFTSALIPEDQPTSLPTNGTNSPTTGSPSPTGQPSREPDPGSELPEGGSAEAGTSPWLIGALIGVPILVILAAVPMVLRMLVRRRRWATATSPADEAEAAWAELRDSMIDLRLPWDDRVTLRQRAKDIPHHFRRRPGPGEEHLARLITSSPEAEAALNRIVLLVERARYARTVPDVTDIRRDVEVCVASLRLGVEKKTQRKATWLPASLLKPARRTAPSSSGLAALDEPSTTRR